MMDRPPNDLAELAEDVAQFLRGRFKHPLVSKVDWKSSSPPRPRTCSPSRARQSRCRSIPDAWRSTRSSSLWSIRHECAAAIVVGLGPSAVAGLFYSDKMRLINLREVMSNHSVPACCVHRASGNRS